MQNSRSALHPSPLTPRSRWSRRAQALALVATTTLGVPAVVAHAETPGAAAPQPVDFAAALNSTGLAAAAPEAASSSSSSTSDGMAPVAFMADPALPAAEGGQPPPYRRRRYGRPSYSDRMHNADGSNKLSFVVGGGFNEPVGDASSNYLKLSWRFEGGVGYNFSRKFGVVAQFDYDNFGLPGSVLSNQENLYTAVDPQDGQNGAFTGLDGSSHIWSFSLNPTFNFYQGDSMGAYAVVGGGFYHKVTNFTVPSTGEYCDPYYGCYTYQSNQIIDHYTSNAPGVTGGVGITYKFSRFANERFFAEARYVHTFNQARYGDPLAGGPSNGTAYNLYPPNSNETSYIPITFGIRF